MAVTATTGPLRRGLDLVPGSVALIGLRAGLVLLASLPSVALVLASLVGGPARQPFFVEVPGRLPLFHVLRLLEDLGPGLLAGVAALAALLTVLGQQLLVAGGLSWLAAEQQRGGGAIRGVMRSGLDRLWPMLKVLALSVLFAGLGLALIGWGADALERRGEVAGWTGHSMMVVLPALRGLLSLLWLALVGAWAFWCRVLMVADGRQTARGAWVLVARVARRRPGRGPMFHVVLTLLSQAGGALVLIVWRQSPPAGPAGALLWTATWLLTLVAQAFLWHWLLHAARLLYAGAEFDDVRLRPDGPLGLWSWLRRQAGRLRRTRP